ncbi:GNAT family N-acetyltransferase [Nitriliruptor alkaliphilus]|uniref:GNAT family N-acetyltransferase n=1 Tax=Nitriliruptor alkaliphilus TaxID=427918 RepID=UPI0006966C0F|nr:GNAT family N-acetyltransferase [Nitriliruptor alkaliphilus]
MAATLTFTTEDPSAEDVRALLGRHLAFSRAITPPEHAYIVEADGLDDPGITLVGARRDGVLLGVGAIRELDADHAELKSMHVLDAARGGGIGRALAQHLLSLAAERSYRRLSLETGTDPVFTSARGLYASLGFEPCGPFGDYTASPFNTFMALDLGR